MPWLWRARRTDLRDVSRNVAAGAAAGDPARRRSARGRVRVRGSRARARRPHQVPQRARAAWRGSRRRCWNGSARRPATSRTWSPGHPPHLSTAGPAGSTTRELLARAIGRRAMPAGSRAADPSTRPGPDRSPVGRTPGRTTVPGPLGCSGPANPAGRRRRHDRGHADGRRGGAAARGAPVVVGLAAARTPGWSRAFTAPSDHAE